jgi:hypothetical protein
MLFAAKWMELKNIMLSDVKLGSKGERLHSFLHIWKL